MMQATGFPRTYELRTTDLLNIGPTCLSGIRVQEV